MSVKFPRSLYAAGILLVLFGGSMLRAAETPLLLPARDVDITYVISQPDQPTIRQRTRWSAAGHLERVDGPDRGTTISDHDGKEITLIVPASRTYRKLEAPPRRPLEPAKESVLIRGAGAVVAKVHCTDWSWTEDGETHIVCATPDGVLLRLVVDGKTVIEARSVSYRPQRADLFRVPFGYVPALAPDGGTGQ
jgi:hypothetical protein